MSPTITLPKASNGLHQLFFLPQCILIQKPLILLNVIVGTCANYCVWQIPEGWCFRMYLSFLMLKCIFLCFFVSPQVSEQEMDDIIARSTHRDKMSRNKHSFHSQGLTCTSIHILINCINYFTSQLHHFTHGPATLLQFNYCVGKSTVSLLCNKVSMKNIVL